MSEPLQVLFADHGYTVYQIVPNPPTNVATAINLTAAPPATGGQQFIRELFVAFGRERDLMTPLPKLAETYMRRVLDLVVNDGITVKANLRLNALTVQDVMRNRDSLRQQEEAAPATGP